MEKIIVNEETTKKALEKLDNGEILNEEDKIILRNLKAAIKVRNYPRIYSRNRFNSKPQVDLHYWGFTNLLLYPTYEAGQKLDEFFAALQSIADNPRIGCRIGVEGTSNSLLYRLYQ